MATAPTEEGRTTAARTTVSSLALGTLVALTLALIESSHAVLVLMLVEQKEWLCCDNLVDGSNRNLIRDVQTKEYVPVTNAERGTSLLARCPASRTTRRTTSPLRRHAPLRTRSELRHHQE